MGSLWGTVLAMTTLGTNALTFPGKVVAMVSAIVGIVLVAVLLIVVTGELEFTNTELLMWQVIYQSKMSTASDFAAAQLVQSSWRRHVGRKNANSMCCNYNNFAQEGKFQHSLAAWRSVSRKMTVLGHVVSGVTDRMNAHGATRMTHEMDTRVKGIEAELKCTTAMLREVLSILGQTQQQGVNNQGGNNHSASNSIQGGTGTGAKAPTPTLGPECLNTRA